MNEYKVDIKGILERLKRKLEFKYDTELSEILGKDPRYVSVIKGREAIGSGTQNKIIAIAHSNDIDLNYLIYGKHKGQSEDEILTRIERKVDRLLDNP